MTNNDDHDFSNAGRTSSSTLDKEQQQEAATIEAIAARIPHLRDASNGSRLTPMRAHYLKKTLVRLQIEQEMNMLSRPDALSLLGPPFKPSRQAHTASLPITRFLFHHFVLTFPFLRSAPPNFFADKVQVFIDRFMERNISGTDDREETTKRKRLGSRFAKWFALLMSAAIHVRGDDGAEQIVKITDADRARLFAAHDRRYSKANNAGSSNQADAFEVNVIGVRSRKQKVGRLHRGKQHDEFIIRTRQTDAADVYVSRRYGDFARLADTLRLEFPEEEIPRPPQKDRRETDVRSPSHSAGQSTRDDLSQSQSGVATLTLDGGTASDTYNHLLPPASPGIHTSTGQGSQQGSARTSISDHDVGRPVISAGPLARERNRLTLRAYLRTLLANPHVADSETMSSFLLSEPIDLAPSEIHDTQAREALDAVRDDESKRFTDETNRRVTELREHLQSFKADLIQRDGLTRIFATIKATPNMDDLPESYRALMAWGRISLASTLFHIFVGGDTSSDIFGQLKRIHGLMPYFVLRGILRISNPVSMIRGVLDLFLAQPFGQRSLAQRMLTSSIQEEVRELGQMAERIASKIEDDLLCERVRSYVHAPFEFQKALRDESERDHLDLMTVILKCNSLPGIPPNIPPPLPLSRGQIHRVVRSSRAFERYKQYRASLGKDDIDEGPDAVDEDAWLYEDLHVLLKCVTRIRDKEQMISLLFEGVTSELLKDIVTIFYSPLAQVYKAANIADSLSDLQAFINDLIRTVEANEELGFVDPQKTVQIFIDLVQRHESRFYHFVHQVHSKGAGLFDGLMHWIELFINFVRGSSHEEVQGSTPQAALGTLQNQRRGVGEVDLEICMPAGGPERQRVLHEIDCLVVYAYRLKLIRELKLKRRLADREVRGAAKQAGLADGRGGFGLQDENDDDAFVGAMVENLGVSDAFTDEVGEVEAEEELEDEEDEEDDEDSSTKARNNDIDDEDEEYSSPIDEYASSSEGGHSHASKVSDAPSLASEKPSWRPPKPQRSVSTLTARAADKELPPIPIEEAKRRRKRRAPKAPTLHAIPEMLPLFVEMVKPLLRPARSASATSLRTPVSPAGGTSNEEMLAAAMRQSPKAGSTNEPKMQLPGGWM
jgi:hypothetical protein